MPDLNRVRRDRQSARLDVLIQLRFYGPPGDWGTVAETGNRQTWGRIDATETDFEIDGVRVSSLADVRVLMPYEPLLKVGDRIEQGATTFQVTAVAHVGRNRYTEAEAKALP